jgi:hypothetical protein
MEKLKNSLKEFGFVQPAVAREDDGLLIGGHQRLAALRELLAEGGKSPKEITSYEVPVVLLSGISDERARLLNLALNKISGEWDYDKLGELLSGLSQVPDLDIELSGFTMPEVEDITSMMAEVAATAALPTENDEAAVAEGLAAQERRFVFKVETDPQADACKAVLAVFGMTGPGNAAGAFVALCEAAAVSKLVPLPQEPPKKKGSKKSPKVQEA